MKIIAYTNLMSDHPVNAGQYSFVLAKKYNIDTLCLYELLVDERGEAYDIQAVKTKNERFEASTLSEACIMIDSEIAIPVLTHEFNMQESNTLFGVDFDNLVIEP